MRASKPEVAKAVIAAVEAQLGAFRAGDLSKAYSYAAATLRRQRPMPAFGTIVRDSYPEIWANTRSEHGLVRDDGTNATVLVHVFSKSSNAAYDYVLVKERGGWRIAGVLRHDSRAVDKV